jgi:hypothetical protein
MAWTVFGGTPHPLDDHFLYQKFIETLAQGRIDLTIPGFHGSDILSLPWYLLTRSPVSQIVTMQLCAVLLPLCAFLAGRSLFRSTADGVLLACIVSLMPFVSVVGLRGWTGPAYWCLMLLSVWLAGRGSRWTGIAWALAILTKPFAIGLLPLILVLQRRAAPKQQTFWARWHAYVIAGGIVAAYLLLQLLQAGHLIVGAHPELGTAAAFQGPLRVLLNAVHGVQILFSVHNYYYPDPALTGPGNMLHTSPLLMVLGIFAMLYPTWAGEDRSVLRALLLGAAIAFGLSTLLDHMDHYYMEAGVLLCILAALPALRRFPLWIPVVLLTLHFQWFYFYLDARATFQLHPGFCLLPLLSDALLALWCLFHRARVWGMLRAEDSL